MTDTQQIKELRDILMNSKAVTYEPNVQKFPAYAQYCMDKFFVSHNDGHLTIDYQKFAEALYNAWYRKVDENAVVLTRATWFETQNYKYELGFNTGKQIGYKKGSKQTAKEIFTKLIEVANNQHDSLDGKTQKGKLSIGLLKAWAIEYGVEVEK